MPHPPIEVTLRVPGPWLGPDDFDGRLPEGYRLGGDDDGRHLVLPDGSRATLDPQPADDQFPSLFANACTREPSDVEKAGVENYRFNAVVSFPGGSFEAAHAILRHGRALLDAGGAGVWVDNSGIAHGAQDWRDLAGDEGDSGGDGGGPFWAFVMSYGIGPDVYTLGMHVMGRRDAVMKRTGEDAADTFHLRNFLAYSYRSGVEIRDGDECGADDRPLFRVTLEDDDKIPAGSPMHNPFGRYRLNPLWDPARGLGRE